MATVERPRASLPPGRPSSKTRVSTVAVDGDSRRGRSDVVATEEPLEVRLVAGASTTTVAVTMRTPGSDFELAAGFLFNEGVIRGGEDIAGISYCLDGALDEEQRYNIVNVALRRGVTPEVASLERHFFTTSACGVCGKASLDSLRLRGMRRLPAGPAVSRELVASLPGKLATAQRLFEATGGLHAAALFDAGGNLLQAREDVGRHNALDKLIGWAVLRGLRPLSAHAVLVSGRSSFEIVQKCLAAGVPILCSVSAPSSLAVTVAREFDVTLVGFLRGRRFNVYSGEGRIA